MISMEGASLTPQKFEKAASGSGGGFEDKLSEMLQNLASPEEKQICETVIDCALGDQNHDPSVKKVLMDALENDPEQKKAVLGLAESIIQKNQIQYI